MRQREEEAGRDKSSFSVPFSQRKWVWKKFHFSDSRGTTFSWFFVSSLSSFWATCRSSGCLGNGSPWRQLAQCQVCVCVCARLSVSVSLWMETVWVWRNKGGEGKGRVRWGLWRKRTDSMENWEREDDIPRDKWEGVTVLSEAAKWNTGAWSKVCPLFSSTRPWPLYLWSVYVLEGAMKMLTIFSSFFTHSLSLSLPGHAGCCGFAKLPLCS